MPAVFGLAGGARADDYRVDSHRDLPHWKPGSGVCTTSPRLGSCTLRAAIMEANAHPGPDRVVLGPGTYLLSYTGAAEDRSLHGDLDVTDDLVIEGAGAGTTTIRSDGRDRLIDVHAAAVEVGGVSLTHGNTVDAGEPGGAIRNAGTLRLRGVRISNSLGAGGTDPLDTRAIENRGALELDDVWIDDHQAATPVEVEEAP